jgi:hypothetical protein
MAATLTAGTYSTPNTREVHEGNFTQYFKYEAKGDTCSAGAIVLLGYIPQNVTVIDCYVWGALASTATTVDIGSQASTSALGTATSISAAGISRMNGFVPRRFSLSADAEGSLRVPIVAKLVALTTTQTGSLNVMLIMTKDPLI